MTPSSPPHRRYLVAAGLAALIVAGALAACSSSYTASTGSAVAPAAQPGAKDAYGANDNPGAAAGGGGAANGADAGAAAADPQKPGGDLAAPQQLEPQLRSLIYTGTMSVKVDNVSVAADRAVAIANTMGGAVGGDKRSLDADRSEATLVLRVPSEKFDAALGELAKLGTELTRSVDTQDVTEALVDLDARLATQRASVDRVRALLAKAQTIGEVVSVESELTRREADLDSLEQRKAKLAGLVALSTITVELRGPAAPGATPTQPDDRGFLAGLRSGWSAFVDSIKVFLVIAGWLLPWLVAIGLPLWLILYLVRRRRTAPAIPATATPAPAPAEPTTQA